MLFRSNIEADDVISYLTTDVFIKEETKRVTIMSDDKDFLQLIDDRVQVWRPVEKKLYRREEMVERFGMHPENFILYKIFIGDNSDNIPGIKGVGHKTLINKFPFITEQRKVDIDEVLRYCESNKDSKYAIYKSVLEQKEGMELNYNLMQLHNVDIAGNLKMMIADMATRLQGARLLTWSAAHNKDAGLKYTKEAAMAKLAEIGRAHV